MRSVYFDAVAKNRYSAHETISFLLNERNLLISRLHSGFPPDNDFSFSPMATHPPIDGRFDHYDGQSAGNGASTNHDANRLTCSSGLLDDGGAGHTNYADLCFAVGITYNPTAAVREKIVVLPAVSDAMVNGFIKIDKPLLRLANYDMSASIFARVFV